MVWFNGYRDGKALATGFLFIKLRMTAVRLPIDIDQFYCPQGNCPPQVRDPVRTTTWSMIALNKEGNNFWNWTKPYILLLPLQDGGVAITDARFVDIQGTSSEREAIKICAACLCPAMTSTSITSTSLGPSRLTRHKLLFRMPMEASRERWSHKHSLLAIDHKSLMDIYVIKM